LAGPAGLVGLVKKCQNMTAVPLRGDGKADVKQTGN
jgi:hypothetical protein